MEGNWVIGKLITDNTPKKTIISDITIESTGLCINLLNIYLFFND